MLLTALAFQISPLLHDARFDYASDRYDFPITLGRYLAQHHSGEVLAAGAAGKIAFFSELRMIDMRGLTDITDFANPGHDKIDPEYVLGREPDLIAGWLNRGFDMNMGMHRERYENAGYRLRLIVYAGRVARERNVIDVNGLSRAEILRLHQEGYRFAVLAKAPSSAIQ